MPSLAAHPILRAARFGALGCVMVLAVCGCDIMCTDMSEIWVESSLDARLFDHWTSGTGSLTACSLFFMPASSNMVCEPSVGLGDNATVLPRMDARSFQDRISGQRFLVLLSSREVESFLLAGGAALAGPHTNLDVSCLSGYIVAYEVEGDFLNVLALETNRLGSAIRDKRLDGFVAVSDDVPAERRQQIFTLRRPTATELAYIAQHAVDRSKIGLRYHRGQGPEAEKRQTGGSDEGLR